MSSGEPATQHLAFNPMMAAAAAAAAAYLNQQQQQQHQQKLMYPSAAAFVNADATHAGIETSELLAILEERDPR